MEIITEETSEFKRIQFLGSPFKKKKSDKKLEENQDKKIKKVLLKKQQKLLEKLADIEHTRWTDWQKYVFSKSEWTGKGYLIPKELCFQWQRQINTQYKDLSEKEKDSDREQVMKYWDLIK